MPRAALPLAPFLAVSLLFLAPTRTSHAAERAVEHRTAHYDLRVEGDLDPVETGAMLEALHGELTRFFGRSPARRLRIEIYATHERFLAALRRDDQPYESGGGLYGPTFGKVWLSIQPTEAYTRQLILHEATHQFHFLVATDNRFPSAHWYTEGFAEFMAMANWDGTDLNVGVIPAITVEDYPARARRHFDVIGWDLEGALRGRVAVGQAASWALVHFLAHRDMPRFRRLGARLERREDPAAALRAVYGKIGSGMLAAFRSWLVQNRQPWEWRWNAWQERGDWIVGESDVVAISTLKSTPRRLDVEIRPVSGPFQGGLVFGYRSTEDFHLMTLSDDRVLSIVRRRNGAWHRLRQVVVEPPTGPDVLSLEQNPAGLRLSANGRLVQVVRAPGQVGLTVDGCKARFRPVIDASAAELARATPIESAG